MVDAQTRIPGTDQRVPSSGYGTGSGSSSGRLPTIENLEQSQAPESDDSSFDSSGYSGPQLDAAAQSSSLYSTARTHADPEQSDSDSWSLHSGGEGSVNSTADMDDATFLKYLMGTDTGRLNGPESTVDRTIKYESENHHQFSGYRSVRADSDDNDSGAPILGADSRKDVKDYHSSGNLNRTTRISLGIDLADGNTGSGKSVSNALQAYDRVSRIKVTSQSREPLCRSGSSVSFLEGAINYGYHSSKSGAGVRSIPCAKCSQILDVNNDSRETIQGQPVCNHCVARERPLRVGGGGTGALLKRVTCTLCKQATDLNHSRHVENDMYICLACQENQSQLYLSSLQRSLSDHGQQAMDDGVPK